MSHRSHGSSRGASVMCPAGVRNADLFVARIEPVELSFPIQSLGGAARAARKIITQLAIHAEPHDCVRHPGDVTRRVSEPVHFGFAIVFACPRRRIAHTKQPARGPRPTRPKPPAGSHTLQFNPRLTRSSVSVARD